MADQNPPFDFLLTPYQLGTIIDYRTVEGRKFYDKATSPISNVPFDGSTENLLTFLDDVTRRANEFGWDDNEVGIFEIPDNTSPTGFKSLLSNYGEFSLQQIQNHENTYINGRNRAAQDTVMLHHALMNSLSPEGKGKVIVWRDSYILNNIPSGLALFKIIIRESHIDSQATAASIRLKLSNLDMYLPTIGHNVGQFNRYVKRQVQALRSRGEDTQDLLTNLFKAYLVVPDKTFSNYIIKKKDEYDEGATMTADTLMIWAKIKYDIIQEEGKWNAPTDEEQKILALQTKISQMEKRHPIRNTNKNTFQSKRTLPPYKNKPEWFKTEPKMEDKHKSRTWYGHQYFWCGESTGGKCNRWRQHKPHMCWRNKKPHQKQNIKNNSTTNKTPKKNKKNNNNSQDDATKKDNKRMKLNHALSAIAEKESDNEYNAY